MKTIPNILLSSATGICLGVAALCSGQTTNLLYTPPATPVSGSYPTGRDNYNGAIGGSFKAHTNMVVSHLGFYSTNTVSGLNSNHYVTVFASSTFSSTPPVYAQVLVPAGTNVLWMSNYYWVQLTPPVMVISNSTYSLVAQGFSGDGDPWHDLENPGWNSAVTGSNTASGGVGEYGPGGVGTNWPPASLGANGNNNMYCAPGLANIPVGPAYAGVLSNSVSIASGQTLNVVGFASGQPPISYQWFEGTTNSPMAGQTNATMTIANVTTNNSGTYFLIASNSVGGANQSANVVVTVTAVPISITQQPTNATVYANYPATFSVAALGTPPITYQWFRNGVAIGGATASSYSLYTAISNNGDVYNCLLSNSIPPYTSTSSNATLTVNFNLAYPQEILYGYNSSLSVNNFSGQVGGQFTTTNSPRLVTHLGYYAWPANTTTNGSNVSCVLTNSSHYVGIYTSSGSGLLTSVQVPQGTNPVIAGYMWQPLDPPMVLSNNTQYLLEAQTFSGSDPWGNVFAVPNLNPYFAGQCDAVYGGTPWGTLPVSVNGLFQGDMYSAPNMAILAPATPIAWGSPVGGVTTYEGFTVTLTGYVAGAAPVICQWYEEPGILLTNQTNLTLTLSNATVSQSGNYYLLASNYVTQATGQSPDVNVTINADVNPFIVQDIAPTAPVIVQGSSVSFSATFGGSPSFTYGWQLSNNPVANSARISGANSNVLTINDVQPSDAGPYQLLATNSVGSGQSSQATLTVVPLLPFNNGLGFTSQGNTLSWPNTNILQLTQGTGAESNSAFSSSPLYIGAFEASFTYQLVSPSGNSADGVTFCIQNDPRGAAALGADGGALGVSGTGNTPGPASTLAISPSVEFEMDVFANGGVGVVAIATNGVIGPYGPTTNETPSLVLTNGDVISNYVTYNGAILHVQMTDVTASSPNYGATFVTNQSINITTVLGTNVAYVGFTGADGGTPSTQQISNFSFVSLPQLSAQSSGANLVISWPAAIGAYTLMQSPAVGPSANWTPVATTPSLVNGQNQVSVPLAGAKSFYELVVTNVPNF